MLISSPNRRRPKTQSIGRHSRAPGSSTTRGTIVGYEAAAYRHAPPTGRFGISPTQHPKATKGSAHVLAGRTGGVEMAQALPGVADSLPGRRLETPVPDFP
ncbi:hypothetical protein ACIQZB_28540 [Streptomyces sp. NPDC097727]|uniref:hypothetical protein n=1 Tax=Streptomyces sp. NPDC097727 TaxID=3366092 RepID=UPI0037F51C53